MPEALASAAPKFFSNSTLQSIWSNNSLSLLQTCPFKYYLSSICGWRAKAASHHLVFGGHYATAMETYHKSRSLGMDHEDAVDFVVNLTLEATFGWDSEDTKKSRETLIRSIVWYFEEYKNDSCTTIILADGSPAVELNFLYESGIKAPDSSEYLFTGRLDRLVDFGGNKFVMDEKTTGSALGSYYFQQYDLDNQMSHYTLTGRVVFNVPVSGVIIDAAQIMVGFTAFSRGITTRSEAQLEAYQVNTASWLRLAERFSSEGYWPQNRTACGNYGGCAFRRVCAASPEVQNLYLETDFEKVPS